MRQVPVSAFAQWGQLNRANRTWVYPTAIDLQCPLCSRSVTFTLPVEQAHLENGTPVRARCSGCAQVVRFFIVDPDHDRNEWGGEVWVYPAHPAREALELDDLVEPALVQEYEGAIAAHAHGLWRPAAQLARTVLEGLVASKISSPDRRQVLADRLRQLAKEVDLSRPLLDVAEVLKDGGNFASHFQSGAPITSEMAEEMLDLLDAFIEYVYLLPERTERLRRRLENESPT